MDSLVCKPSVPVHCTEQREPGAFKPFRESIEIHFIITAVSVVCDLEHEMMVGMQPQDSHETGLIDLEIVVEVTELPDQQSVYIALISCNSEELLTCNKVEPLPYMPLDVCILDG